VNIEGTSLVAPVIGISMIASPSSSGIASEGFTAALVAQVGLISAAKAGEVLPVLVQAVPSSPVVAGVSVTTVDTKSIAGLLLGNNLPSKDNAGYQAALVAVTDALKYVATGETASHVNDMPTLTAPTLHTVSPLKSLEEVTAQATPVQPTANGVVPILHTVSPLKSLEEVHAQATPVQPTANGVVPTLQAVSPLKSLEEVPTQATPAQPSANGAVTVQKSPKEMIAPAIFGIAQQSISDDASKTVSAQQDSKASGKKPVETSDQPVGTEECIGVNGLLVAIINPVGTPVEHGVIVADLASADVIEQEKLPSFVNFSPDNEKKNQPPKASDNAQNSISPFGQSIQDKQSFKLNYFENTGQVEITGPVDRQVANVEVAKTLPPVVGDTISITKPVVELKADVPTITKPLGHPEWNKDLGERIVWMANRAIPAAEIRLNPPQLGPISVRVDVADDQATVVFTAQHAATRDAIEASMPRLREMMSAQQFNLVEVSVFQGSSSDQWRSPTQNFTQTAKDRGQGAVTDEVEQEIESNQAIVSKGLLSIYA
jgi:flagellar hook-length control protein FliK